ncbi:MAG: circadian clock protein KaiB [Betaproteobacteria bacterium]|nr:circadian clock protein KaiB [Betaproteobacteria bacterium]
MSKSAKFRFRLYIAGDAQNSAQAVANLTAFCKTYLENRHAIEVVNVFKEPKRALADGILMTPTLVKLAPTPAPQRIVGTLSQTQPVLQLLGLETLAGAA